jgi:hypothetical protein
MSDSYPERDYGLPPPGATLGPPRAKPTDPSVGPCPNCGCNLVCAVEINVKDVRLRSGKGVAMYIGCPACPWASPAVTRAT